MLGTRSSLAAPPPPRPQWMPPKSMRVGLTDTGVDVSTDFLGTLLPYSPHAGHAVGKNGPLSDIISAPEHGPTCAACRLVMRAGQAAKGAKEKTRTGHLLSSTLFRSTETGVRGVEATCIPRRPTTHATLKVLTQLPL